MATAAFAIPIAIQVGESEKASTARAGSGTISTAPIAVKWCATIAKVSRTPAVSVPETLVRRVAAHRLAAANSMPTSSEAMTRSPDQTIWPGISSAHMPR